MTASATFNSPYRIICGAMENAGLLAEGSEPNSEQLAKMMNRLNDVLNFEQTNGLKLWLQTDLSIPLVAGQATYSIFPGGNVNMTKPMRAIDSGYYLDTSGVKRPIILISRDDYAKLSQVTQTGAITSYWPDKQIDRIVVSVWLVPDATAATGTMHLAIQQQCTQLIQLNDTMNFPQEWFLFAQWALADDICTGQPKVIMDRCAQKAAFYRMSLENWDVEDAATSFAPDPRIAYQSRFPR